jgi:nucleotidyltransferase substrate binding protein (TIGR01987 family)
LERLDLKRETAVKALKTLNSALKEPYSEVVRDAVIKRFEYTFEALWKYLKEYLLIKEGKTANTPKSCFREALSAGLLTEDECQFFLEMTDDGNLTSHTYEEVTAEELFKKIPRYDEEMGKLLERAKAK